MIVPASAADEILEFARFEIGDSTWSFGRHPVTGRMSVVKDGVRLRINLNDHVALYPQSAFVFDGEAYLFAYDLEASVPSGRSLASVIDHSDIFRVMVSEGAAVFEQVVQLPVGIDVRLSISSTDDALFACVTYVCARFDRSQEPTPIGVISMPAGTEIVETHGRFVLLQHVFNDQRGEIPPADATVFSVCELTAEMTNCEDVPADVVPYDLREVDGQPVYRRAGPRDWEALLRFDLDQLGLANLGEPNLEGRIAWSAVYYVNGLTTLAGLPIEEGFRRDVVTRLRLELASWADQARHTYPFFLARRYSIDREPIAILLHYARIARTAKRAAPFANKSDVDLVLGALDDELFNPKTSIEEIVRDDNGSRMQFRRFVPFWADGVNVPWNFQSAWLEAIFMIGMPDHLGPIASEMISDFVVNETLEERPDTWSYAGGVFREGWSGRVDSNSHTWSGQASLDIPAHISYRSMDMLALLEADRAQVRSIDNLQSYAARLIETGYLYPFVNEALGEPAPIPFHIARHYVRSRLTWHFQNQVWAAYAFGQGQ